MTASPALLTEPMSLAVALDFADHPRPKHTLQAPADTNGELYRALAVLAAEVRALEQRVADLRNRLNLSEKLQGRFPVDAVQPDTKE